MIISQRTVDRLVKRGEMVKQDTTVVMDNIRYQGYDNLAELRVDHVKLGRI